MSYAAPEPKANMGQPVPRVDGRLKVTGAATYAADVDPKNVAHAYLVTSTIAKGSITAIDDSQSRKIEGVIEIFTHRNMADAVKQIPFKSDGGAASTSIVPLSSPKIWHIGQIVALVVADRYEAAVQAGQALKLSNAEDAPSATFGSPGVKDVPIEQAKQAKKFDNPKVGDFAAAFGSAPVTVDSHFATPTQHHNPIELYATTCFWDGEQLLVHEPSQTVGGLQHGLAEEIKVDPNRVRTLSPFIGGAFGGKATITPRTAIVAVAAKRLSRPVKLVASRAQGFTIATYRAETQQRVQLGADKSGKLQALSHEGWEITSRPDDYSVAGTETTTRLYACPNVTSAVTLVKADRNTPGFMRAPPETPYMFGLESAMDELAEKLGMDPIELRRVNDTQKEAVGGLPFSSRSVMACFDAGAKAFDWSRRSAIPGKMRDGEWLVGLGCAMSCYPTNIAPAATRVRFEANGRARVSFAGAEIGVGIYTVAAQIAAKKLGIPVENVDVVCGDSTLPPAPVAGGSNQTASNGNAVSLACDAICKRLSQSGNQGGSAKLQEGRLVYDGGSEEISKAFQRIGVAAIEEYAEFLPAGVKPEGMLKLYQGKTMLRSGSSGRQGDDGQKYAMYAWGAQFVEAHVHSRTREVRVPRMTGAFAMGHVVNPRTAHSQLMGGMIWGLSSGLLEQTEIDGRYASYVNDNLAEYLVPVAKDIGEVEVIMLSEEDKQVNPLGIKGVGELGIVGGSAALANAVYNATGIRVRDLPIRIEKLLAV